MTLMFGHPFQPWFILELRAGQIFVKAGRREFHLSR